MKVEMEVFGFYRPYNPYKKKLYWLDDYKFSEKFEQSDGQIFQGE